MFRKCVKLQPFIVGLVGVHSKLQNCSHDRKVKKEVEPLRVQQEAFRNRYIRILRKEHFQSELQNQSKITVERWEVEDNDEWDQELYDITHDGPNAEERVALIGNEVGEEREERAGNEVHEEREERAENEVHEERVEGFENEVHEERVEGFENEVQVDLIEDEGEFERNKRIKDTRRIIQDYIRSDNIQVQGLVVAVNVNGKTKYKESFGLGDIEKNIRATTEMRSNIASISKLYTAYLIMKTFEVERYGKGRRQRMYLNTLIQHKGDILYRDDEHLFSLADLMHHLADLMHTGNQDNYSVTQYNNMGKAWLNKYRYFEPDGCNGVFLRVPFENRNKFTNYTSVGYEVLGVFLELYDEESFTVYNDAVEGPVCKPYYNILTDELRRLNMNDTFLHRVEDITFNYFCGYAVDVKAETHKNEFDLYLDMMRHQEFYWDDRVAIGLEDDPYKVNAIKEEFGKMLCNCGYVNYSGKYPSEGLIANINDLSNFGDMFLRMEQDRSNGGPLSPSLAKLMWTLSGLLPNSFGRNAAKNTGWFQQCLGFNVVTSLHFQRANGESKEFKTTAFHGGKALGYCSQIYITFIKCENYLLQPDFTFAPKAIHHLDVRTHNPHGQPPPRRVHGREHINANKRPQSFCQKNPTERPHVPSKHGRSHRCDRRSHTRPQSENDELPAEHESFRPPTPPPKDSDEIGDDDVFLNDQEESEDQNQPEGITVALISNIIQFENSEPLVLKLTELYMDEIDDSWFSCNT